MGHIKVFIKPFLRPFRSVRGIIIKVLIKAALEHLVLEAEYRKYA
jgi:hypothetical protein